MPRTIQEKVLDYIQVTGIALEKAEKQAAEKAAHEQKIAEAIPGVVEKLLRNGRIEPHQKEAAANLLQDPLKALEILGRTAEHRNSEELARLGTQTEVTTKRAAARGSLDSPYVGVRSSEMKESDRILFEKLGLSLNG